MEKESKTLTYDNLIPVFLNEFPEFRETAEEHRDDWQEDEEQDTQVHVFFGYINKPIVELLSANKNKRLLSGLFDFFELMANSKDEEVIGVLYATILEYLGDDKKILKKARSLMGEKSLELSHKVEKSWGRE
jgi:hypothetical protein